jgi:hypothetical protein
VAAPVRFKTIALLSPPRWPRGIRRTQTTTALRDGRGSTSRPTPNGGTLQRWREPRPPAGRPRSRAPAPLCASRRISSTSGGRGRPGRYALYPCRRADLAPPVHAHRDVDVGHETLDGLLGAEAFHRVLQHDRECLIVVLVADEHPELVIRNGHCSVLPGSAEAEVGRVYPATPVGHSSDLVNDKAGLASTLMRHAPAAAKGCFGLPVDCGLLDPCWRPRQNLNLRPQLRRLSDYVDRQAHFFQMDAKPTTKHQ